MPALPPSRPLVVSTDEDLLDELLRLVAAAGAEAELASGGPALRRAHREAALVLVGAEALAAGALRALPRRPGVVVVTTAELPAEGWAAAVEAGAERVAVLPADEGWLLSRCAAAVRAPAERGRLVAVGGACGGAGASTLAAAVALAAPGGAVLVDADAWGGGLDLLLGAELAEGLRWPDLAGLRGEVAGDALLGALPGVAGIHLVSADRAGAGPIPDAALSAVVGAGRGSGRPVVVDLPRPGCAGPGRGAQEVLADADLAVLVVPARLRAATAARQLVGAAGSPWSAAHLVVRTLPGGLLPGDVAEVVGRPVVAELPHDRGAVARAERGQPPGAQPRSPLAVVARRLLAEVTGS
ncbi:septum formation initiator [Blastococcus sp. MG754426]|uniref:septum site-determining protein Ssd n=1 Tax=unclassified Blastococcus TaxID=2619396 RepID=UPI001EEF9B83|nr:MULTISPECIES: septum site-determining protein Ssd [unclassified Blastococcus]MCF6506248.1 septum formation initiator [Blastococcus sp. MG754426]MCF6510374.1 septum formation initiator [Blastococcus sp. MG754427]MCF6737581.1 septum formation initiator [Blastococcus sp. KM273129]